MRVDLHCHSIHSDGSLPPEEVAARARSREVELFCLTDHDSCGGTEATRALLGERAMRGVELSCHDDGRTVHLLVYDVGGDWSVIDGALEQQGHARRRRLRDMAARLEQLGVPVDIDAILTAAGGRTVGRPDLARALADAGHVKSTAEAFGRYLRDGGPADISVRRLSVEDGLALARAAGARVSLAHPDTVRERAVPLLRRCREAGLEGIEAIYGRYSNAERKRWLRVAAELELVVTAGSDFHGAILPQVANPVVELPEPHASRLLAWLGR